MNSFPLRHIGWLLAIGLGAIAPATPSAQQPVFRSEVNLVRVDVLVTNRGTPVRGLTAEDFEVRDNGVIQEVQLATTSSGVSVILALDTSSSVAGERLRSLQKAATAVVSSLRPQDSVTLLTFSDRIDLLAEETGAFADVSGTISRISAAGRTAVRDAVFAAAALSSDSRRSVLILFSDGSDTSSWLSEDRVLEAVKRGQLVVYVVGDSEIEPRARAFLQRLAEQGAGELLLAEHQDLPDTFAKVLERFRSRYLLSYTPRGVPRDRRWHPLTVQLKGKPGRIVAREGYFAK